jgi:hypothetical protein
MPVVMLPGAAGGGADDTKRLPKPRQKRQKNVTVIDREDIAIGGLRPATAASAGTPKPAVRARAARPTLKNDPKLVSAARELRDRWLEQINTTPLLPAGKYDVSRALAGPSVTMKVEPAAATPLKQLPEAA